MGGVEERIPIRRRVVYTLMAFAIVAVCVGVGGPEIGPSLRAAAGHGTRGTLLVTEYSRGRNGTTNGDFASADGRTVHHRIGYIGVPPDGTRVGDTIPALDTGGLQVYPPAHSTRWLLDLVFLLLAAIVLAGWLRWTLRWALPARRSGAGPDHAVG